MEYTLDTKRYVKRPVEIEAVQLWTHNASEVVKWIGASYGYAYLDWDTELDEPFLIIETLEGNMTASVGDYIIKGIKGEFYPCREDIFEESYREL